MISKTYIIDLPKDFTHKSFKDKSDNDVRQIETE